MAKLSTYSALAAPPSLTDLVPVTSGGATRNVAVGTLVRAPFVTVGSVYADYTTDSNSDNVELQAAIDANTTNGATIVLTSDLLFSAAVQLKSNITMDLNGHTVSLAAAANSRAFYTPTGGSSNIVLKNGTIDGNRTNQTSGGTNSALVDIGGNGGDLVNCLLDNLYVKNTYQHAIYVHGTGNYKKVVRNCIVQNHGSATVIGFGIYFDFATNSIVTGCTVYDSNGNDSIELGNSGHIVCTGNYIKDGDIQFPFSHYAVISNNILRLGKIINDTNTANNVTIIGNQLPNATPATSGYAAIRVDGANSRIIGNYVFCNVFDGIKVQTGGGHIIEGNYVESDAISGGTESGILAATSASNCQIKNNIIKNYDIAVRVTYDNVEVAGNKAITCTTGAQLTSSALSGHIIANAIVTDNDFKDTTTGFDPTNQTVFYGQVKRNTGANPEVLSAQGNVTGATTFNRKSGDVITATLTGNITVTLTNGISKGDTLTLVLSQDGTGSRSVTWPSNFKKAGGTLTLSTVASAVDSIQMVWDGTNWREVSRTLNMS